MSWDTGDKSMQCGRKVDAFKLWLLWKARGDDGLAALVDNAMARSRQAPPLPSTLSYPRRRERGRPTTPNLVKLNLILTQLLPVEGARDGRLPAGVRGAGLHQRVLLVRPAQPARPAGGRGVVAQGGRGE